MRITEISLTNFRSFQATQSIALAPVTLLFGPNSVGKSSVLMALFYIQQILEKGQCDPQLIDALGEKHVGGFKRLVNGRDISKRMVIKLSLDKSGSIGASYNQVVDLVDDDFALPVDSSTADANRLAVEFHIAWSKAEDTAYVACYKVWLDDSLIAELASDAGLKQPVITWLNYRHPALLAEADQDNYEDSAFVSRFHELLNGKRKTETVSRIDSGRSTEVSFEHAVIGFAGLAGALPVPGKRLETVINTDDPILTVRLNEILSDVVVAPLDNLLALLNESLCIGPLRLIPDALHQPDPYPQQKGWYSGAAAWDVTGRLTAANMAQLNQWLNTPETLNLGYSLRSKSVMSQAAYTGGGDTLSEIQALFEAFGDSLSVSHSEADADGNPLPEEDSVSLDALRKLPEAGKNTVDAKARQLVTKEFHNKWVLWDDLNNIEVAFSEVGVGISQLFPLVVAAVQDRQGIIACEQPELHVHPRIQVGIGDLLTQANKKTTFLIETHSEHLILRILRRIRETSEGELPEGLQPVSPADVSIVYMEPGEAGVRTRHIEIDSSGEFTTRWPHGFFAERGEELF
ncbi:AAA family ATPase [Pseudomonas aeruginosa]|uniref:AAA family ATPase n=1 Tax=Pseudomonas aeruginosa TaxID=287 RepID=UPI00071BBA12|nr:AAA family ATPase [Pseudomonas aeruginosa]EJV1365521.1 AAA family ATPase [Pseudomonas aeruginosa]EJV1382050.1 AAA family ATPase [Pseudomonas aeruginosa]EJV1606087.1 AAA family ATPase [Pseudomonas aeruginosa]EKD1563820.1 AAA family ATPase [Pseudomonas aeruginosa]EKJ6945839.1 AAA family ATPase [Pseudomonas aeruginosa]